MDADDDDEVEVEDAEVVFEMEKEVARLKSESFLGWRGCYVLTSGYCGGSICTRSGRQEEKQ